MFLLIAQSKNVKNRCFSLSVVKLQEMKKAKYLHTYILTRNSRENTLVTLHLIVLRIVILTNKSICDKYYIDIGVKLCFKVFLINSGIFKHRKFYIYRMF